MGKYLQAKEVVKDKFWIVERNGTKCGTLRLKENELVYYENNSRTETIIDNLDGFKFESNKNKKTTVNISIFGYPTNTCLLYTSDAADE